MASCSFIDLIPTLSDETNLAKAISLSAITDRGRAQLSAHRTHTYIVYRRTPCMDGIEWSLGALYRTSGGVPEVVFIYICILWRVSFGRYVMYSKYIPRHLNSGHSRRDIFRFRSLEL